MSLPSSRKPCSPLGSVRCFSPAAPWALLSSYKHGALGAAGLLGHSQGGRALLCSLFLNGRAYQNPGLSVIRAAVLSPRWGNGEVMWARRIYLDQRETHAQVALDGSQMPTWRWMRIKLWRRKRSGAEKGSRVKVTREVHASERESAEARLVSVLQGHLEEERKGASAECRALLTVTGASVSPPGLAAALAFVLPPRCVTQLVPGRGRSMRMAVSTSQPCLCLGLKPHLWGRRG